MWYDHISKDLEEEASHSSILEFSTGKGCHLLSGCILSPALSIFVAWCICSMFLIHKLLAKAKWEYEALPDDDEHGGA